MSSEAAPVFKKRERNIRKRERDEDKASSSEEDMASEIAKAKGNRRKKDNPLAQSSQDVKAKIELPAKVESKRTVQSTTDVNSDAVRTLEVDTEYDRDHISIVQRGLEAAEMDHSVYHGLAAHTMSNLIKKREGSSVDKAHAVGPVRMAGNVRISCRFDYQPDICKDYKETGYCGYGDNCKFMHDRGDYKSGWQLEKEWEAQQERKRKIASGDIDENDLDDGEASDDDDLPFACFICRESFVNPIVTKCMHYFCEKCAFEHHKKSKRCFICNEQTFGLFNTAHKLLEKIAAKKQKLEEKESSKEKRKAEIMEKAKQDLIAAGSSGWSIPRSD
eukprot:TRINITY_DN20092_c0_g1::TRINITY_DN20092_c0_g1_i1::g.15698::m.15698 TRINITY_DN20092_c0_g1::TRINITY_DN20092_c0_g1_i1::g.15698  ORF type:complete len:352 (+),score=64.79,sp/Q8GX84/C3H1_ARATH/42.47/5e-75,zf-CCCH/PF00642.19/8.8e-10,zf-C3HC4_2/PF13923.1/1.2e-08,zf-C3HC4_3/PF13920.1/1.9e-08,zf-RING_5/PF14634.1/4.1e-05,zf-RING_2/PF13639.1/7.2e-05,zf-C3HC4/PF00097.20/0.00047,zf-C3HC4_4/PF15227.1/0.0064,zf-RING_UBOX/PF13445.1/0.028,zf-P11/PF03854.9/3.7 TRINITY_DN20092_c0_g1_i1:62-1057(+)